MSITKLHIFNKNTDAVYSIRGYEYQKLKTLEAWLENGLKEEEEIIYCEYEEDIFQHNKKTHKAKFRQLKLYSSVFSFSTEEIQKALVHFFSLFTKPDYLADDVEFVFEATSTIAREQAGNNGQLLKDWNENQGKLSPELLAKCIEIVKSIVTDYYDEQFNAADSTGKLTKEIEEGYYAFKAAEESIWERFVKAIRWKFDNVTPEEAIDRLIVNIERLILAQPKHNIKAEQSLTFLSYLLFEVSQRSYQTDPQDRILTISLLQSKLLEQGTEKDVWYSKVYNNAQSIAKVNGFGIGDFYEFLSAAQYCRNWPKLYSHTGMWIGLLRQYYSLADINEYHKKKCLYEIVWLTMKPDYDNYQMEADITGLDAELRYYFSTINNIKQQDEFADMLNLLNITFGMTVIKKSSFNISEIGKLIAAYTGKIDSTLGATTDLNLVCYLLEYRGLLNVSFYYRTKKLSIEEVVKPFYEIISLLSQAVLFNLSELEYRLNGFIGKLIATGYDENEAIILRVEQLIDDLQPHLQQREGGFKMAGRYIERGITYLKIGDRRGFLKALNYFHNAKELYLADETMEGYVLAILNISQIYSAIGLHLAAKYYALTSLWISINNVGGKLLQRIPQSFQLLFTWDISQGAWMSAISGFNLWVKTLEEFGVGNQPDDSLVKSLADMGLLFSFANEIKPELAVQFQFLQQTWPEDIQSEINGYIEEWDKQLPTLEKKLDLMQARSADLPLGDLGTVRTISWNALGSRWNVTFENTAEANSVGEEFCAILQIMHAEIALTESDFNLLKSEIHIEVLVGDDYIPPEQISGNKTLKYKTTIKCVVEPNREDILRHGQTLASNVLYLFGEISLLPFKEIANEYKKLTKEDSLHHKFFTLNAYHRIYFSIFNDATFTRDQRRNYTRPVTTKSFSKENKVLGWLNNTSPLYSQEKSLKWIGNRYDVAEQVAGKTISKNLKTSSFVRFVKTKREQGWLDWQITLAIVNFILDYKVYVKLKEVAFSSKEERFKAMRDEMNKLIKEDEDYFPVEFPPEAFETKDLEMQIQQLPHIVLQTWGLECRTRIPNFPSLREFLNHRFNFNIDEIPERSPLASIL